jgi:uncharacterized coiled-coil protein SlyX
MDAEDWNDRLIRLESAFMHLQHDHSQMNDAILGQQREIEALKQTVEQLRATIEGESPSDGLEVRDPLAEKPPHY